MASLPLLLRWACLVCSLPVSQENTAEEIPRRLCFLLQKQEEMPCLRKHLVLELHPEGGEEGQGQAQWRARQSAR